ncbi:hypothetical protein QBC38DRAFT_401978 [Podospora fimiseda]|uniref:Uncharacterized protein n=1 Tax=Podospora fimiseda TaxID=252190 RepID=A0AAN6YT51_9PEZI|nr:hypothetical protein QBC38DRAFT_401978 [Podospora fimiseda]
MSGLQPNTLYIALYYLGVFGGQRKYHWGLFNTSSRAPAGDLIHATDVPPERRRRDVRLDLMKETRPTSDPLKSGTLVCVLKIGSSPGKENIERFADRKYNDKSYVHLMDPRYLPHGEQEWTCRVWVKEVLNAMANNRVMKLPADVNTIEQWCNYTADRNVNYAGAKGQAAIYNDLSWMSAGSSKQPATLDPYGGGNRHYGSSPMDIDSSGRRYGSTPMDIDSSGRRTSGYPSRMEVDSSGRRTSGYPSRMDVDTSSTRRTARRP